MQNTIANQRTGQNVNIDLTQATDMVCESCGHNQYEAVYIIKRISTLISPTGKEIIVPVQIFACKKCGNINKSLRV